MHLNNNIHIHTPKKEILSSLSGVFIFFSLVLCIISRNDDLNLSGSNNAKTFSSERVFENNTQNGRMKEKNTPQTNQKNHIVMWIFHLFTWNRLFVPFGSHSLCLHCTVPTTHQPSCERCHTNFLHIHAFCLCLLLWLFWIWCGYVCGMCTRVSTSVRYTLKSTLSQLRLGFFCQNLARIKFKTNKKIDSLNKTRNCMVFTEFIETIHQQKRSSSHSCNGFIFLV